MSDCDLAQRFLDGRLTDAERQTFEGHLATCADCQALVTSWRTFSTTFVAETAPMLSPPDERSTRRLLTRARGDRTPRVVLAVALAAAAAVVVVVARRPPPPAPSPVAVLEASTQPRREALGDDLVGLTAGSAVEVRERSAERVELALVRGSVAASVKKRAPGSSFVIRSGEYDVTVVGTRFRVEHLEKGVRVSVVEGLVRVRGPGAQHEVAAGQVLELEGATAKRSDFTRGGFPELGDPEQVAAVDAGVVEAAIDAGVPVPAPKPVAAAQLTAWRQAAAAGHCPRVLAELQRAATEHRRQAAVWRVLADCQRLMKDAAGARASYEQVIAVGTSDDAARARPVLASLLQDELGAHEAAVKVLTDYLRTRPSAVLEASARVKLARSYLALGQRAQAKRELNRVVSELPSSPPAIEALELLKSL